MDHEVLRGIEFVSDRERLLFEEARLGEEAIGFLQTEIGRYLHGRAKGEYDKHRDEMVECDLNTSDGVKEAQRHQFKAEVANSVMLWLADLITNGENAYQQLKEESNEQ